MMFGAKTQVRSQAMRRSSAGFVLCSVLMLAACASTAATLPVNAGQAHPAAQAEQALALQAERLAQYLSTNGADAPRLEQVQNVLGAPDVARREGAGAALTYRYETCALLIVFAADESGGMRLQQTFAEARRARVDAPDLQSCAREALARGAPGV